MPKLKTRALLASWIALFTVSFAAEAALGNTPVPAPPKIKASSYILMEHHTGRVLASHEPAERVEPASITKIMTAYAVFRELGSGRLDLADRVRVSEKAWRTPGSRMFIEVGKEIAVEDLVQGMIVQSGNDASVALAEHIAGDEATFAELMNGYAAELGLTNTHYQNSTGLPATEHYTTTTDVARLARALITEFPQYYAWYSQREFTFNGIRQHNRNALLWRDDSVDGVKTGMTEAAGYCLVSSAKRDGMRLISVVMGTPSEKSRAASSLALLNYAFRFFETHRLYPAGQEITRTKVWKGASDEAALGLQADLYVTIPRGQYADLTAEMDVYSRVLAPLDTQQELGQVRVSLDGDLLAEQPLRALEPMGTGSLWRRTIDGVLLWFD